MSCVRIGIVIDGTYSFITVYKKVYNILKNFLKEMETKRRREEFPDITVEYALTVFHENPQCIRFHGRPFTNNAEEVISALEEEVELYGGNTEGYENINQAIRYQLELLGQTMPDSEEMVDAGILVFSDAEAEDDKPNFYDLIGLRFANVYTYSKMNYSPIFHIIDGENHDSDGERNLAEIQTMEHLVNLPTENATKEIRRIVEKILNRVSAG